MSNRIEIDFWVLDGNLGDWWADQRAVADAYAGFFKSRLESELSKFSAAGWELCIEEHVQYDTEGYERPTCVNVIDESDESDESDDGFNEKLFEIEREIEEIVNHVENVAWDEFCRSPEAAALAKED